MSGMCRANFQEVLFGLPRTETRWPKLLELPMELHLEIFDLLDLRSAARFAGLNSYLRSLMTRPRFKNAMLRFESSSEERDSWTLQLHMPCYGCVRVVAHWNFVDINTFSQYRLHGADAVERRCRGCDQEHGNTFERLIEEEM